MTSVLCIDIGTSRIKAALIDEAGAMIALRSERVDRAKSPDTQDLAIWRETTLRLIREMSEEIRKNPPEAVSLTGNMHALICLDAQGDPLQDAILWCSNGAEEESAELISRYPEFAKRCGNLPAPVFTLPKMLRFQKKNPELYRKTKCFLQPKDDIGYLLTGVFATDPTDASGMMPFLPDERRWDFDLIRDLGLEVEKFPEIRESSAVRGKITRKASALTGLPEGLPVICGAGDLATAALGCGASGNVLSLTLGTAGQLLASGPRGRWKELAGKLFVFSHADPDFDLFLGSVPGGGFSLEWEAKQRNLSMEEFFRLAEQAELKESLPVYLPYLLGRGAPYMDYTPSAEWIGISAKHSLADLCKAAIFGPLAALRQSAEMLAKLTDQNFESVVLQSLACREHSVRDTAAALFPQGKRLPENTEASLLGAAILGMKGINCCTDFKSAISQMVHTQRFADTNDSEINAAEILFQRYLRAAERHLHF